MFALFRKVFGLITVTILLAAPLAALDGSATAPQIDPTKMTPQAIDAMVARMSDDQVRALLLDRLDAVASGAQTAPEVVTLADRVQNLWTAFTTPLTEVAQKLPDTFQYLGVALSRQIEKAAGSGGLLTWIGLIALVLAIGFAAEFAVRAYLMRRVRQRVDPDGEQSLRNTLHFLFRQRDGGADHVARQRSAAEAGQECLIAEGLVILRRYACGCPLHVFRSAST